jgi:glycosyltransferase involved in cell wall biosynthesis
MRVALVTYGLHVGGMETFLLMLAEALRANGMQVTFILTEGKGAWYGRAIEHGFHAVLIPPSMWRTRRQHAVRVLSVLKGFDVVILNHSAAAQPAIGELSEACRVISILHNDHDNIYRVGLSNLANIEYVVAVGSKILSEAKRLGAPSEQVVHIPHGVEVPRAWPKELDPPRNSRPLKAIYLGRIDNSQKGVFDLPSIFSAAVRLGAKLTFDVVGDGEPDLTILRRKFADACPDLKVIFHGRKERADAIQFLSSADILIMPSRFEGFPVTLLEAIAHGVVPVASNLPGITDDAVTDGLNGILPPVGDVDRFAQAIFKLQDDELRRRMSFEAWRAASEKFRQDIMVDQYLWLLNSPRRQRSKEKDQIDAVGRKLFGRSWSLPIGLARLVDAFRTGRVLVNMRRCVRNLNSATSSSKKTMS